MGVTTSETDIIRDQQERDSLHRSIASAESALADSAPGTRRVLENLIRGAQVRIATLDTKIKDEREAQVREQVAAVMLAQKEAALTAREQAEYSGFLKEDFFTKRDFGRLEHFYAGAWNRLSEEGKYEMSHRVWEGIRHNEYRFTDLPKDVREKEEDRIYSKLSDPAKLHNTMQQIPESDRADFVRAYDAGDREETGKVLNRESFRKNTAVRSPGVKHETADDGKQVDNRAAAENVSNSAGRDVSLSAASTASAQFRDLQIDTGKLKGVTLVDANSHPLAALLPAAPSAGVNMRN